MDGSCETCGLPPDLCVCDGVGEAASSPLDGREIAMGPLDRSLRESTLVWGLDGGGAGDQSAVEAVARTLEAEFTHDFAVGDGRIWVADASPLRLRPQLRDALNCEVRLTGDLPVDVPRGVIDRPANWEVPTVGLTEATGPDDRALRWRVEVGGRVRTPPAVGDDVVAVGTVDGVVYGVSASGDVRWRAALDGDFVVAPPVVRGGTVYAVSYDDLGRGDDHVYALDGDDGTVRWSIGTHRGLRASPVVTDEAVLLSVVGRRSEPGAVRCLDPETGDVRWETEVGGGGLALDDECVYAASEAGLAACRRTDGHRRWTTAVESEIEVGPVVVDGTVVVGSASSGVHAFDAATGDPRWTTNVFRRAVHSELRNARCQLPPWAFAGVSALAASEGTVYAGTYNAVFAIDPEDGAERWALDLGCDRVRSLSIAGDRLSVGADDGSVFSLATRNGDGGKLHGSADPVRVEAGSDAVYFTVESGAVCRIERGSG